jgi:6-phosphogluconolactonase (cycloisomerase 2 family)
MPARDASGRARGRAWGHSVLPVVATAVVALGSASCGEDSPVPPAPQPTPFVTTLAFVYTANSDSGDVSALTLRSDGTLAAVLGSPFRTGGYPRELAVDERGRHLCVLRSATAAASSANSVAAFASGSDGSLTPVPGSPFAEPTDSSALAMHPSRDFLYVTRYERLGLYVYGIDGSGSLRPLPFSPVDARTDVVRDVVVQPSGSFLYLASASSVGVGQYPQAIGIASPAE